jgi:hypothetical protein
VERSGGCKSWHSAAEQDAATAQYSCCEAVLVGVSTSSVQVASRTAVGGLLPVLSRSTGHSWASYGVLKLLLLLLHRLELAMSQLCVNRHATQCMRPAQR